MPEYHIIYEFISYKVIYKVMINIDFTIINDVYCFSSFFLCPSALITFRDGKNAYVFYFRIFFD